MKHLVKKQPCEPDVEAWLEHLIWLHQGLDAGTLDAAMLTSAEAKGLRMFERMKLEFKKSFRSCPRCAQMTDALLACEHCGEKLVARSANGGSLATGH